MVITVKGMPLNMKTVQILVVLLAQMKKKLMRRERRKGIRAYGIILIQSLRIYFSLWNKSLQMPKNLSKHYPTITYAMLETYFTKYMYSRVVSDVKLTDVRGKLGFST